jgi:thymidine phosphorylase
MSKKIAEGIDALVMDVKCGRGAFMKERGEARRLAESLVAIGKANGVRTEAMLTAMDAPLGRAAGNALEVVESIETLKGRGPRELEDLSVALAARMLRLGGVAATDAEAEGRVRAALTSGRGVEKLRQIIEHQGGDPHVIDDYRRLPAAPHRHVHAADRSGHIVALDAELIGRATMVLGAGRNRVEESVDPAVGAVVHAKLGDAVRAGQPILELHHREPGTLAAALALVRRACVIADEPPAPQPLIHEVLA